MYRTPRSCAMSSCRNSYGLRRFPIQAWKSPEIRKVKMSREGNAQTLCRIYRILGFLCLTAGCLYQSCSFIVIYLQYPTTVEVNVMHLPSLKFPAVTICNNNRVRLSQWCKINESICEISSKGSDEEQEKILRDTYYNINRYTRMKLGHQKEDFIVYCDYDNMDCFHHIHRFYDYEYTNCYTFNAAWGRPRVEIPMATLFNPISGKSSELLICLNLEEDEYTSMDKVVRARMTIHDSKVIPNPRYDGVSLLPNTFYSYGVRKNTIKLLEAPYQPGCRNYKSQREKRVRAVMTQEDCLAQCIFKATIEKCNCTFHRFALLYADIPCKKDKESCLFNNTTSYKESCYKYCRMPCEKTTYDYIAVDSHKLQKASLQYDDKLLSFVKHHKRESNLVCIRVYYGTSESTELIHNKKFQFIELFSHIGGYTGLWLGFSFWWLFDNSRTIIYGEYLSKKEKHSRSHVVPFNIK